MGSRQKVTPFNSTSEREADGDREQDGEKQPLNMTERERKLGLAPKLCSLLTEQRTKPHTHIQVIGGWLLRICRITDEVLPQREKRENIGGKEETNNVRTECNVMCVDGQGAREDADRLIITVLL